MAQRGRPPLHESQRMDKMVVVRVTYGEYMALFEEAMIMNDFPSLSAWARKILLDKLNGPITYEKVTE